MRGLRLHTHGVPYGGYALRGWQDLAAGLPEANAARPGAAVSGPTELRHRLRAAGPCPSRSAAVAKTGRDRHSPGCCRARPRPRCVCGLRLNRARRTAMADAPSANLLRRRACARSCHDSPQPAPSHWRAAARSQNVSVGIDRADTNIQSPAPSAAAWCAIRRPTSGRRGQPRPHAVVRPHGDKAPIRSHRPLSRTRNHCRRRRRPRSR
jgi:hypothetical protein